MGGNSLMGFGGAITASPNATGYGGGGGAGYGQSGSGCCAQITNAGGSGTAGIVIFEW
jgi:hypothetical protein